MDLFAAGVILFNIVTSSRPFTVADSRDELYKHLFDGRADLFWEIHDQGIP